MGAVKPWFVLTGGPSTGKTTLLTELEKLGFETIPEAARLVIDEALEAGISVTELRKNEAEFQQKVLERKVSIEASLDPAKTYIFDRGMHDTLAYLRFYGYELSDELLKACQQATHYAQVFLLDPLETFTADYARTEGTAFAGGIHQLLHDAYDEYGMKPLHVPPLPITERLTFILKQAGLSAE